MRDAGSSWSHPVESHEKLELFHLLGFKESRDRKWYKASPFRSIQFNGVLYIYKQQWKLTVIDYKHFNTLSFYFFSSWTDLRNLSGLILNWMHLNWRKCFEINLLTEVVQKWYTEVPACPCGKTVTVFLYCSLLAHKRPCNNKCNSKFMQ